MSHLVIIGNGISGITCARHVRKLDSGIQITVISAETEHFYARTALMYIYMGHMKYEHTKPYEDDFWRKNRIELVYKYVTRVEPDNKQLLLDDGTVITYDKLVLATGSKSNFFGWSGQELKGVQGLYSYQDLQQMEAHTKEIDHAVIVGGGLIGIEMAEMLLSRNIAVTMLVREQHFWGNVLSEQEGRLIERHIKEHHIRLMTSAGLSEIKGDAQGKVSAIITKDGQEIPCGFVGIATGVSPNIDFLRGSSVDIDRGVLVNEYLETNIPDVYATGDCAQFRNTIPGRKPIEQVWYTGRMQGKTLARTICGNKTVYDPGPWFNSAKFLDIEYQNYGLLPAELPEGHQMFYWEHKTEKIALRMHFRGNDRQLVGINVFGMRMRHELFDEWLRSGAKVDDVLVHLKDANFDPELFHSYEPEIIAAFNKEYDTGLVVKQRSWQRILQKVKKYANA